MYLHINKNHADVMLDIKRKIYIACILLCYCVQLMHLQLGERDAKKGILVYECVLNPLYKC